MASYVMLEIEMSEAYQINPRPLLAIVKPVRDEQYLRFVKKWPCYCCESTRWVDPCHTGPHGIGTKASDLDAIPLCRKCHDEFDAAPYTFAEKHHLDIPGRIRELNQAYFAKVKPEEEAA